MAKLDKPEGVKPRPKIYRLCRNCGGPYAEVIGSDIHVAHDCPKGNGPRTAFVISLQDADFID